MITNILVYIKIVFGKIYDCERLNSSIQTYTDTSTQISLNINDFKSYAEINIKCNQSFDFINYIEVYSFEKLILNNSLNLNGLIISAKVKLGLYIYNIKGIDIKTNMKFGMTNDDKYLNTLGIDYSVFNVYMNDRLFNEYDCLNFNSSELISKNFLTHPNVLFFGQNMIYASKICPLWFNNTNLFHLVIASLSNSFINKNKFEFTPIGETLAKQIVVKQLEILRVFISYDEVSTSLINPFVFKSLKQLVITGYVNNIQPELFMHFNELSLLYLNFDRLKAFFHNTNKKWMSNLKFNSKSVIFSKTEVLYPKLILFFQDSQDNLFENENYDYPDQDFCLFSNFPHEKLVYPLIIMKGVKINCSCTLLFLLQHGLDYNNFYEKVNKNFINTSNLPMGYCLEDQEAYLNLFKKCELENRRVLCNKSSFEQRVYLDLSIFDLKMIVKFIEYLVMVILNPILSIMGIISNVMVMIVVNKVKKKKDKFNDMKKAKDGMFNHIFIHSLFNVFYCVIFMLKLVNECINNTLFCSSVYTDVASQWFKIVLIEFFGNVIKLSCNVSYTSITVSRLIIMKNNSKSIIKKFGDVKIKVYLMVLLAITLLLSLFKLFEFNIDTFIYRPHSITSFPSEIYNEKTCHYTL